MRLSTFVSPSDEIVLIKLFRVVYTSTVNETQAKPCLSKSLNNSAATVWFSSLRGSFDTSCVETFLSRSEFSDMIDNDLMPT